MRLFFFNFEVSMRLSNVDAVDEVVVCYVKPLMR